ncbi:DUF4386 domain-containing protein [Actinoplanes sp. NPDC023714]|uniref:DUF4386 domain-containing protein n=1 Tax=Actinoplanes sp. NPDC023714 TaxID=3154322 RepID=UPI0033C2BAB2
MDPLVRTARTTGLLYLGLAIAGGLGFLLVRPLVLDPGDPAATLTDLRLARIGVALELLIALTQALAAWWFYRLFRVVEPVGAFGVAVFGMANAVMVLGSAALLGTAVESAAAGRGEVALLHLVSDNIWGVSGIFFGLWLVPMGVCVLRSGWLPLPLGWVLMAGGAGYVVSAFLRYLAPDVPVLAEVLVIPASIGEFWVIGYLLFRGVRRSASAPVPSAT